MKKYNLTDVWRIKHPHEKQFTWRRKNGIERSRIDFWLLEENALPLVYTSDIRPVQIKATDHLAISLKLQFADKRGPGFWKFNNSLLKGETYTNIINNLIDTIIDKYKNETITNQSLWELCKYEIRDRSIKFSKSLARQRRNKVKELELKLNELYKQNDENQTETLSAHIKSIEAELNTEYARTAAGAQIRSRVQLLDEGETNLKYFVGLEKSRQTRKVLNSLRVGNSIKNDIQQILDEEVKFYKTLYSTDNIDSKNIRHYLANISIENKLNQNSSSQCDGLFTLEECKTALSEMKHNKSPGSDGLTVEFYSTFWSKIGNIVVNSLNEGYIKGELSGTQKHSILSLIFKKGDPEDLENWRPISLLNIDYKIAAKVLAKRLQNLLPQLISTDQQGYIKGRFIGFNIRQIQDIIDYADELDSEGAILFLDFRKAFGTVDWNFMFEVLTSFGFGDSFI